MQDVRDRLLRVAGGSVHVTQTPTCTGFPNTVAQLARYFQMQRVVLDRLYVVAKQCVHVAKTVACLGLEGTICQLPRQLQSLSETTVTRPCSTFTFTITNVCVLQLQA